MSLEKKLTSSHKTSKVGQEECEPINDICDYIYNDTDLIISRDRCSDEVFNNVSDLNPKSPKTAHGLKFAHLNIRSLNSVTLNKIVQVRILLESKAIDVLALSETWLKPNVSNEEVCIDGYTLYRKDRVSEQRCGGVAIYVKASIRHEYSERLTKNSNVEAIWVTIKLPNSAPFNICLIYRPPSARDDYYNNMLNNFELALSENEVIILGYFNFDYVIDETLSTNSAHHIELLLNCSQLITNYTRSTSSSKSTIDHIYTSMPELHVSLGVIPCSISNHDIIYTILNHSYKAKTQPRVITIRDFKTFDSLKYNKDLMDCNLYDSVNNCGNIDDAWNTWSCTVNNIMNKHAPLKTSNP